MAQTIAQLAEKLGYTVERVAAKTQQVVGVFIGAKQTMTKATPEKPSRPMLELAFLVDGEVQTINCMPGARRTGDPELVQGMEYSVRWFGPEFQTVAGLGGFADTHDTGSSEDAAL